MDPFKVSFVDPLLVLVDVFRQTAPEAAIQNVVATIDRLAHSFADDHRARAKVGAKDANAPDLRVGRNPANHSRDRGAVPVNVAAVPRFDLDLHSGIDDMQIVQKSQARQGRMIDFHSGIDDRDPHSFASAFFQSAPRFIQPERTGIWSYSRFHPTAVPRSR